MQAADWSSTYDRGAIIGPDVQLDEIDERIYV